MTSGQSLRSDFRRAVLKRFLLIALPLSAVLLAVAAEHYLTEMRIERVTHENEASHYVGLARQAITGELAAVVSDIRFLMNLNELQTLLAKPNDAEARRGLAREFVHFSRNKGVYDQIRLMDPFGMEIIRVNHNNGDPAVVPDAKLQNKANRYYFHDVLESGAGADQLYMSPFDLNVEAGQIETPIKPVIRFAMPLFDDHGERKGILLLNFMGGTLLERFRETVQKIAGHTHLVNTEGYWLSAPTREDEWGFMLGHERTFQQDFPNAWTRIRVADAGSIYDRSGFFSFASVHVPASVRTSLSDRAAGTGDPEADPGQAWKIISHVPAPLLVPSVAGFLRQHALYYGSTLLLLGAASFLVALNAIQRRETRAQQEKERRFRDTLESIRLAAVTIGPSGRVLFCNDFLLDLAGWPREEIIGRNWFETLVPERQARKAREMLARTVATGKVPPPHESPIRKRNGETRLIAWTHTLSLGPAGEVTALTSIGEDITERRWNEEQLRKLSLAVEQSTNPVIITDTTGTIEYVNPTFSKLTGYTAEEVIGKNPRILRSGETPPEEYRKLWRTIARGREWRGLFHNRKKSGELYWEYTVITPIRNPEGRVTHYLAIKEDITELRRLEDEIKTRNRALAQVETFAALGRMASMIAHDLRNPLSSVKMTLQILGKRGDAGRDAEGAELKQIALEQVDYMEEILEEMLAFSASDGLRPRTVSVHKVLDAARGGAGRAAKDGRGKVIAHYAPGIPPVLGDPTKLCQVFSNLIVNALQATEGTDRLPEIHIRTALERTNGARRVRVEIIDSGAGVPPDRTDEVFEPFFTTRAKGTGLGLAIVKRILDQHGASIRLEPVEPFGTRAVVRLPTTGARE